jgi:hypothetical protein
MRERFGEFWSAMEMIDSAHRRAGMQVPALLVAELVKADTTMIAGQARAGPISTSTRSTAKARCAWLALRGAHPESQTLSRRARRVALPDREGPMARMIPSSVSPDTPSPGEREVFRRVRDDPGTSDGTVLRSFELPSIRRRSAAKRTS